MEFVVCFNGRGAGGGVSHLHKCLIPKIWVIIYVLLYLYRGLSNALCIQ